MENELDIIESLTAVGYSGKCLQNDILSEALDVGTKSENFREVVGWIAYELHILRKTDEKVDTDSKDYSEFAMELSAMLKELGCPFKKFVAGPLSSRFQTKQDRIHLLEFLITELMTTKMYLKQKPVEDKSFIIPKFETNTARALEIVTKDLGLDKPPENIAPRALFDKLNFKLEEAKRNTNKMLVGESLLNSNKQLSEAQWKKLETIQKSLAEEYNLRRQVLLTRLEVTVQSFQWSDRMRGKESIIANKYQNKMKELDELRFVGMETDIIALLAARSDLAIIEKTSSANVRKNTGTKIQKHVIGMVPDRGGRANEHAPPPPEMPSWQTQRSAGPGGRGGFGGGGGGRGGFGGGGGRGGFGGGSGFGGGGNSFGGGNSGFGGSNSSFGGGNSGFGGSNSSFGGNNNSYGGGNSGFGGGRSGGGSGNWQQGGGGGNNNSGGGSNWLSGSGRVQGSGWQPRNSFNDNSSNDNRSGRNNYSNSDSNRGRSNYNRGGGGGGYRNN